MKVRNISRKDVIHGGRLVLSGAVIDTDPQYELYGGYTAGGLWAPADDEAQAAHDEATAPTPEPPTLEWTKDALIEHAEKHAVDLGGAKTKAEILAAINEQEG